MLPVPAAAVIALLKLSKPTSSLTRTELLILYFMGKQTHSDNTVVQLLHTAKPDASSAFTWDGEPKLTVCLAP